MSAGFTLALCALSLLPSTLSATVPREALGQAGSTRTESVESISYSQAARAPSDGPSTLFQADYVQREAWGLLAKYQQVNVLLQGANLSPSITVQNGTGSINSLSTSTLPPPAASQIVPLKAVTTSSGAIRAYQVAISIGAPPQDLDFNLDTGVADSWVASSCNACDVDQFRSEDSTTYRASPADFRQAYGAGYVWGTVGRDNISVSSFVAAPQYLGAVTAMDAGNVAYSVSGVLGLAFGAVSPTRNKPFFETLIQQNSLPFPTFSVALGRGDKEDDSELCVGCVNAAKYEGNLTWLPLLSRTYWTVALTGLSVGSVNSMTSAPLLAALDTASNQIHVPMAVARTFYAAIPGAKPKASLGDGLWTFPCSSHVNITLSFTGWSFALDLRDFNLGKLSTDSGDCVGAVLGLRGRSLPDNFAVIGTAFLRSWYTVFDYSQGGRVGLASRSTAS